MKDRSRTRQLLATHYVRDGIVLGLTVGVFAVGFGVLAVTNGLTVLQTCAMSLLVFTGASQFAAVGVLSSGGSPAAAVGSALLLAARNGFYGVTMSQHIRGSVVKRAVAAHLTIDESTALGTGQDDPADVEGGFWAGGIGVFVFWNIGTAIGAVGGGAIGDPNALGLDAAFPAGFIALVAPALRHRSGQLASIGGAVIALAAVPLVQPGIPILLAAGAAVIALAVAGAPPAPTSTSTSPGPPAEFETGRGAAGGESA